MKELNETLICRDYFPTSNRIIPFHLFKAIFNYKIDEKDKAILDEIISKGRDLAKKVNNHAANNGTLSRPQPQVIKNCVAGLLAEYLWKEFLNKENILVYSPVYGGSSNQIDLKITANSKTIEVRSSFPYKGIEFAICNPLKEFDILGPYSNSYKPGEIQKDYYVRTLFHLRKDELLSKKMLEDGFEVILAGGATWNMMVDDNIAINKDLIPEDHLSPREMGEVSTFRVVPFSRALDTNQLYDLIKNEKKDQGSI